MTITPDTFVGDIATQFPSAASVFHRYGIDFCCGGRQPLRTACREAGVPVEQVIADVRAPEAPAPSRAIDLRDVPLTELVNHISTSYHAPLTADLDRLEALLQRVEAAHGARLPELVPPLARIVRKLARELASHTAEEENRLFPTIGALERHDPSLLHGRALDRFLEELEDEHITVGRLLERLRSLTEGFRPPEDACATFRRLYAELDQFSATLKQHVHLENYVLFPRAAALGRARADAVEGV